MDDLRELLGSALAQTYDIERELGGGGMSRVFVAVERALGRRVVIKVLPPELAAGVNTERFRREIQLSAQLNHPHIVPVLTAGEIGGMLYYTMPYIEGESLNVIVEKNGPMHPEEVLRVLHDVVDALSYAHSRGVIHRDIKPANILALGNHSLVTDFGVAKAISVALPTTGITSGGFAIGTPAYMAPEQLAADPQADHRVDIYAVGLLAYELLAGTSPFTGTSPQATMAAQLTRVPPPLHKVRHDVPSEMSQLVQRCLEKLPENRPSSAQELLAELDTISTPQGRIATRSATLRAIITQPRKHARQLVAVLGALLLMAAALYAGGTFLINKQHELGVAQAAQAARPGADSGTAFLAPDSRDPDLRAITALSGGAPPVAVETTTMAAITDLTALADSLRQQLSDARRRDSIFLSDSLRDVIEREVLDSLTRLRALAQRSGGDQRFSGARGAPRGSSAALRRPPLPGEKRVLVMDFLVRTNRAADSSRLGQRLADSMRVRLTRQGGYVAVSSRLARELSGSSDPRVMAGFIDAGAVLLGSVNGRRGSDSLTMRLFFSEPETAIQPAPIAVAATTLASAAATVDSLLPRALEALARVTWPAGRVGGRGGRGVDDGQAGRGGPRVGSTQVPPRDTTGSSTTRSYNLR
jgi:hypothetical protein